MQKCDTCGEPKIHPNPYGVDTCDTCKRIKELEVELAEEKAHNKNLGLLIADQKQWLDKIAELMAELALERKIKELVAEKWPGTIAWATAKAKEKQND